MNVMRVLVVDDSSFMRKVVSDLVAGDSAFSVAATAADGAEAFAKVCELRPDVVVMDLEMPSMNGLEALRAIMAECPTPVIMMSAVTDRGTRDTIRALQFGAFDFVRKPDGTLRLDTGQMGEMLIEKLHMAKQLVGSGELRLGRMRYDASGLEDGGDGLIARAEAAASEPAPGRPAAPEPPRAASGPPRADERPNAGSPLPHRAAASLPPAGTESAGARLPAPPPAQAGSAQAGGPGPEPSGQRPEARLPEAPPRLRAKLPEAAPSTLGRLPDDRLPAAKPEPPRRPPPLQQEPAASASGAFADIVAIGTSTGGPRALHEVMSAIPASFPAPILIVQHMPPKFTHSLAQRLDACAKIGVKEAEHGDRLCAGQAYLAPGGKHMKLQRDLQGGYRIALSEEEPVSGHRPSVDVMFGSLVGHRELRRHIVLMTGMGSDGARSMKALRDDGAALLIAEAEETCVVYGMPRSAVENGAAEAQVPLQEIAPELVRSVGRQRAKQH